MDDGAKGWLFKTAKKNYWRVAHWYELDDLIQDGYFCYYKWVIKHSPRAVTPEHRMTLFKLAFTQHITDLANKRTRDITEVRYADALPRGASYDLADADRASLFIESVPDQDVGETEFEASLSKAPTYVRDAIKLFSSDDGARRLRSAYRMGRDRTRETFNDRLCRLTGYDPSTTNIVGGIRALLTEE